MPCMRQAHDGGRYAIKRVISMKYLLSLIAIGLLPCLVYGEDLGYTGHNKEGQSVGEKLNDLKGDKSFSVYEKNGWTIASSQAGVIYSFTPINHPAHPAYVERRVIERDGTIYIDMSARCGASKVACDDLVKSFQELNKKIIQSMGG